MTNAIEVSILTFPVTKKHMTDIALAQNRIREEAITNGEVIIASDSPVDAFLDVKSALRDTDFAPVSATQYGASFENMDRVVFVTVSKKH